MSNDTKTRILETAWTLVNERGIGVGVGEIAAAAGVSRQLVYVHFTSRAGLLVGGENGLRIRERAAQHR